MEMHALLVDPGQELHLLAIVLNEIPEVWQW